MQRLLIKPQFVLLLSEITFLCELAPNAPETELSGLEKRQIGNIYYKYFGSLPISKELIENEMKDKWPDGVRKKTHECQRALLSMLHHINNDIPIGLPLEQKTMLDLKWLHFLLSHASLNYITIIVMTTDVATDVPVSAVPVPANVTIQMNGKKFEVAPGLFTPFQLLKMYNEKYIPIETVSAFAVSYKGELMDIKYDQHFKAVDAGWQLTFTPPAE